MDESAFQLVEYEYTNKSNLIIFKGRALKDIRIGDKLKYYDEEGNKNEYIVCKIITYKREVHILSSCMTGEIYVMGNHNSFSIIKILESSDFLNLKF